jgi:hypothetical protein
MLSSCATSPPIGPAFAESIGAASEAIAETIAPPPEDRPSVRSAIESMLTFIAVERGTEAASSLAGMRDPAELEAFLESRYGYTAYEEALRAFMYWDRHSKAPRWDPKAAERLETEHFSIAAMPGTAGYRERDYVARRLEALVSEISTLIGPDDAMRARFAGNLASVSERKIEVFLPPDSRSLPGFGSSAASSYGLAQTERGLAITASIALPYYNALSSALLAHEVTHVLDIFFKLDASGAPSLPGPGAGATAERAAEKAFMAWAKPTFETIVPSDTGFGEGFAEYVAMRLSPLHRAFFGDPDALLRAMSRRAPLLDDILARSPAVKDRATRIVRYTELASFVDYLIERFGSDAFLSFYMRGPVAEARFAEVYGAGYKEMQAEWKASRGL